MNNAVFTDTQPFEIEPMILEGRYLRLEPLESAHLTELTTLVDPEIWRWYTMRIESDRDFRKFMESILTEQANGKTLAFAIREKATGELVGSSRYMNLDSPNRRLEIGSTWYAPKWQRTFVNTEAKYLMLAHAFEVLSCIGVQFQTDVLNEKSRRAIERVGAKLDGILRAHRIRFDGRVRDSAFYSITASEWPDVRARLLKALSL